MVYSISKRAKGCLIQLSHSRTTVLTLNYIYYRLKTPIIRNNKLKFEITIERTCVYHERLV